MTLWVFMDTGHPVNSPNFKRSWGQQASKTCCSNYKGNLLALFVSFPQRDFFFESKVWLLESSCVSERVRYGASPCKVDLDCSLRLPAFAYWGWKLWPKNLKFISKGEWWWGAGRSPITCGWTSPIVIPERLGQCSCGLMDWSSLTKQGYLLLFKIWVCKLSVVYSQQCCEWVSACMHSRCSNWTGLHLWYSTKQWKETNKHIFIILGISIKEIIWHRIPVWIILSQGDHINGHHFQSPLFIDVKGEELYEALSSSLAF